MADQNNQEAKLNVDGREFLVKDLSDEAKANLQSLQFTRTEIQRLEGLLSMAKTAESAYQRALINNLPK